MYTYKCRQYGDCSLADRGEIVKSDIQSDDLKCSQCGGTLVPADGGGGTADEASAGGTPWRKLVIASVLGVVLLGLGGGAWHLWGGQGALKPGGQVVSLPGATSGTTVAQAPAAPPSSASGGIVPSETETSKARRKADEELRQGAFSEAEKKAARAAALEMIKTAVAKMGQGDLAGAEKELMQARERDATESLVYYNLAIVRLRQRQPEEALRQLETAFMAGFPHFDAMDKDRDLDPLRKDAKFQELVRHYRKPA